MKSNREEAAEFLSAWYGNDNKGATIHFLTALLDRKEAEAIERCARACESVVVIGNVGATSVSDVCAVRVRAMVSR